MPVATCFFRKKLRRDQILPFFSQLLCTGREMQLIPPAYAEPFVKRQKNDTADSGGDLRSGGVLCVGDGRGEQKTLAPLKAIPSRPHGLPDHSAVVLS